MKHLFTFAAIALFCFALQAQSKIKVACIGNSVTYGAGIENRETDAYPAQLGRLLGNDYQVSNFGQNGTTLLNQGHRPYTQQEKYKQAIDLAADLVVIHLGLNDTDPRNWPFLRDRFIADYTQLINSFRKANPKCKIWICRLSPIFAKHGRFIAGTRDWYWQIQDEIETVAAHNDVRLIDLQAPLYNRPELLPDALHPNAEGASLLAQTVRSAITGDYGGLQMPPIYSDNMVLQRNRTLTIKGTANAGQKVTLQIGREKQTTTTPDNGRWSVNLPPMKAGGPYELTVQTPNQKLTYRNVMVGEVWLCSGQSNMEFRVNQSTTAQEDIARGANSQGIRLFDMKPSISNSRAWNDSTLRQINRLQFYSPAQWTACNPNSVARFSAIAYHFGKTLADSLNITIGLILNAVGGSPTEAWIDRKTLDFAMPAIYLNWEKNHLVQDWVRERASQNIKLSTDKLQRHPYMPCYLFETGIAPLHSYPLQGVVWYQGESNAQNIEVHEQLFAQLVNSWRKNWNNNDMPFYFVQLSGINRPSWPRFRDSQRRIAQRIPHTGMVVSSDKGDSLDVHPKAKKEIGERLAYLALHDTYQQTHVVPSGPLFRQVSFKGDAAYISFDHAKGLHTSDGKTLRSFEVAGNNELFYPATAQILPNGQVRVKAAEVKQPRRVRYGWEPFTRANLVNEKELPASTFLSDKE